MKTPKIRLSRLLLAGLIILAAFVRFFRLPRLMTFIGDQGRDYLAARDMVLSGRWPLLGIPSSVTWLHQGPFFIWLTALSFRLFGFNPLVPALMTAFIGLLTVYFIFILARSWFDQSAALMATLIAATSPLMVIHARLAYHISPIPLLSLFYIRSVYLYLRKKLPLFWSAFSWSLLVQFELTTLPLILLIPFFHFSRRLKRSINWLEVALGLGLPFLPKIIYDLSHQFRQTFGLLAWVSYRFLSFFGFSGRHTASVASLAQVSRTIFSYWQKFFSYPSSLLAIVGLVMLCLAIVKSWRQQHRPLSLQLLVAFIVLNLVSFYLHQAPSEAYFPVLFPAFSLLFGWFFYRYRYWLLKLVFIALAVYNCLFLFSNNFVAYGPSLEQRLLTSRLLIDLSSHQPFALKNHSSVQQFSSYLDNYRYLLWWLGKPEDPQAKLSFTIYEGPLDKFKPPLSATVYHLPATLIIKSEQP